MSVLEKLIVPAYEATVLPAESAAVTETSIALPAVAVDGALTTK